MGKSSSGPSKSVLGLPSTWLAWSADVAGASQPVSWTAARNKLRSSASSGGNSRPQANLRKPTSRSDGSKTRDFYFSRRNPLASRRVRKKTQMLKWLWTFSLHVNHKFCWVAEIASTARAMQRRGTMQGYPTNSPRAPTCQRWHGALPPHPQHRA